MTYKLELENEVLVSPGEIRGLFKEKTVYVLGYGSLLYSEGWWGRNMYKYTEPDDLVECSVEGYERGPYGLFRGAHFYGVVPNEDAQFNGVLNRIDDMWDWVGLMRTELIAGIFDPFNYRVVDVTDKVSDVDLEPSSVVHMVVNEPKNKETWKRCVAYPGYYEEVWDGVCKERSTKFVHEFVKTGGCEMKAIERFTKFRRSVNG